MVTGIIVVTPETAIIIVTVKTGITEVTKIALRRMLHTKVKTENIYLDLSK